LPILFDPNRLGISLPSEENTTTIFHPKRLDFILFHPKRISLNTRGIVFFILLKIIIRTKAQNALKVSVTKLMLYSNLMKE